MRSARSAGVRAGQAEDQMSASPAELCKHRISTAFHHQLIQLMDPTARGLFSLRTVCVCECVRGRDKDRQVGRHTLVLGDLKKWEETGVWESVHCRASVAKSVISFLFTI